MPLKFSNAVRRRRPRRRVGRHVRAAIPGELRGRLDLDGEPIDLSGAVFTEHREPTLRVYRLGIVTPDEDAAVLDNLVRRLREYFTDRLTMAIRVQPNGEVVPEAIEAIRSELVHVIRECGCEVAPGETLRIRVTDREVRVWTEREASSR